MPEKIWWRVTRPICQPVSVRVLFTSSPAYGHLLPMLPLLRAATSAGAEVRLATGPDRVEPLRRRGIDAWPVGPPWSQIWPANERVWADDAVPAEAKPIAGVVALFGDPAARD